MGTSELATGVTRAETAKRQTPLSDSELVLTIDGHTYNDGFCREFVINVAKEALEVLQDFTTCSIELNVYSAPWEEEDAPQGQVTLRLLKEGKSAELGLVFGAPEEARGLPYRRGFDCESFKLSPMNPHSCGIFLGSFDECWSLVCRLVSGLHARQVFLSFGA
ncbi:MAG: hypothetical protein IAE66_04650 [Xanthomonadaceae bacterium]|nr:hypothetical protein [Xanthomonadaceae bacterium]